MPTVKVALICQGFELNSATNEYSIHKVYEARKVKKFPVPAEIGLVIFLGGKIGEEFDLSCTIVDKTGDIVADRPPSKVVIASKNHVVFHVFRNVTFKSAGVYAININVNGICIDTVPYTLIKE